FHEHVGAIGSEADAADIHQMRGAGEQADQSALVEARRGDDEVVEMPGAHPRIVGDVGLARTHGVQCDGVSESPGRMVSNPKWAMKCLTDSAIELTWPGVPVTACASMRPVRSKMPAE